jgi:hypothetical protein
VNLLDPGETITVVSGPQTPPITLAGTSAKVFLEQTQARALDPVVTSVMPAHDSKQPVGQADALSIKLRFSKPMDTSSVEAAFFTVPSVAGSFVWSPPHDEMTFQPRAPGFPEQVMVTVHLRATAKDSESGNALYAAFESRFRILASGNTNGAGK